MRVASINMSGGVGKTTVATYLLIPRMAKDTRFFAVESINRSADDLGIKDVMKLRGREFGELYEELMVEESAVIDVGASNIETFLEAAKRFAGGTSEIDSYLIPTPPDSKYITESIATANRLIQLGVPTRNIRFVLNRLPREQSEDIDTLYGQLMGFATHMKSPWMVKPDYVVYADPLFEELAEIGLSLETLISDQTDYRTLAKAETDREKRKMHTSMRRMIAQAGPLKEELDRTYKALFG